MAGIVHHTLNRSENSRKSVRRNQAGHSETKSSHGTTFLIKRKCLVIVLELNQGRRTALLPGPAMRNVEENFGLGFYDRTAGKQSGKTSGGGWSGMVGEERHRAAWKQGTFLSHCLPSWPRVLLLLLQHLKHGAVMLSVAPAACRQIGFRTRHQRRQSGIAGENQQQRTGDELGHDCFQYSGPQN